MLQVLPRLQRQTTAAAFLTTLATAWDRYKVLERWVNRWFQILDRYIYPLSVRFCEISATGGPSVSLCDWSCMVMHPSERIRTFEPPCLPFGFSRAHAIEIFTRFWHANEGMPAKFTVLRLSRYYVVRYNLPTLSQLSEICFHGARPTYQSPALKCMT